MSEALTALGRHELIKRIERLEARDKLGTLEERLHSAATSALGLWGERPQLRQLTEECGELIAAVNQRERGRISDEQLAGEVADVFIMVMQARLVLGETFDSVLLVKLERLEKRIRSKP